MKYIDIVFQSVQENRDTKPELEFVEVENAQGASVGVGRWIERGDGYTVLRLFEDVVNSMTDLDTKEPFWTDHCTHGHDCYVDSFIYTGQAVVEKIDIYVYPDDYYGHEICLRYGDGDNQYYSPTGFAAFLRASECTPMYAEALKIILDKGKLMLVRNVENPVNESAT